MRPSAALTDRFDLQGHRGARGLKPENTLPSFEIALDIGVTSIETDVHLSLDGEPVLHHDPYLAEVSTPPRARLGAPAMISSLETAEIRQYRRNWNPDAQGFPDQNAVVTPVAQLFAEARGIDPFSALTLSDLLAFVAGYVGELGAAAGKSDRQRERARRVIFDLELKRVPYHPEYIGDQFAPPNAGLVERRVVEVMHAEGMTARARIRSFDHRCVRAVAELDPTIRGGILVGEMAAVAPAEIARAARAAIYCPHYLFLDPWTIDKLHEAGLAVIPYTVNDDSAWERLLDWGVDGITTDLPDRLAAFLGERGITF